MLPSVDEGEKCSEGTDSGKPEKRVMESSGSVFWSHHFLLGHLQKRAVQKGRHGDLPGVVLKKKVNIGMITAWSLSLYQLVLIISCLLSAQIKNAQCSNCGIRTVHPSPSCSLQRERWQGTVRVTRHKGAFQNTRPLMWTQLLHCPLGQEAGAHSTTTAEQSLSDWNELTSPSPCSSRPYPGFCVVGSNKKLLDHKL